LKDNIHTSSVKYSRDGVFYVFTLIVLPWIFYFPTWLRGMARGDNLTEMWQTAEFAFEQLRHGRDPLWNPYLCSGFPVGAYPNTGMYSILNLLHLILPPWLSLQVQVMLVHGLAGVGLYLFARRIGASRDGALLGGVSFSFCGFITANLQASYFMPGAIFIGLVFWILEKMRGAGSFMELARWTLIGSLLLAIQFLAGHPQMTIISGLLYALFLIWFSIDKSVKWRWRLLAAGATMASLAVGLTATQWISTLELLHYSVRETISYERFTFLSVSPERTLTSVFFLLGMPAVLLAWRGLRDEWSNTMARFLLASIIISGLMMLGKYIPVYKLLFHVPVIKSTLAPARYSLGVCFASSCLVALGWDSLRRKQRGLLVSRRELLGFSLLILLDFLLVSYEIKPVVMMLVPNVIIGIIAVIVARYFTKYRSASRYFTPIFIAICLLPVWLMRIELMAWFIGDDPRPEKSPHWKIVDETIAGNVPARIMDFVTGQPLERSIVRRLPTHNLNISIGWSDAAGFQPLMLDRYSTLLAMDHSGIVKSPQLLFDNHNRAMDLLNVRCLLIPAIHLKSTENSIRGVAKLKYFNGVPFGESLGLRVGPSGKLAFRGPDFVGAVNGVAIISAMNLAADISQGEEVAELALAGSNNESRVLKLRAGIETADATLNETRPSKTVLGIPFFEHIDLPLWAGLDHQFKFQQRIVNGIALLTYLYNAERVAQNAPVAKVEVIGDSGASREYLLRAGVNTAHWTAISSASTVAHRPATIGETFQAGGVVGHLFLTILKVEPPIRSSSIRIKCLLKDKGSGIFLSQITLTKASGKFSSFQSTEIAHNKPPALPNLGDTNASLYFAKWNFPPIIPKWIELRGLMKESSRASLWISNMTFLQYGGESWPVHPVDLALGNSQRFNLLYKDDLAVVIKNKTALPRAWLAGETIVMTPQKILEAVTTSKLPDGSGFDPLRTALIEKPLPFSLPSLAGAAPIEPAVDFEEYSANRIRLKVAAPRPGVLVLSEIYYPGWETEIDGRLAETLQVDYVLRGALLQPGRHEVVMRFRPATVRNGRVISLACLGLVLIALCASFRFGRRSG